MRTVHFAPSFLNEHDANVQFAVIPDAEKSLPGYLCQQHQGVAPAGEHYANRSF
jgi:hypothetical protein